MYRLKDENDDPLKGKFYEAELSLVRGVQDKVWTIDKVIKVRGNKALVRWFGHGPEYDSWVPKSQVKVTKHNV